MRMNHKGYATRFFFSLFKYSLSIYLLQQSVHRQMLLSSRAASVDPHRGSLVVINEELMRANQ